MGRLIVHARVHIRHPELEDSDVETAWNSAMVSVPRLSKNPSEYVALGFDGKGRLLEMVGIRSSTGDWLIFHAMTPPSKRTLQEFGIRRPTK